MSDRDPLLATGDLPLDLRLQQEVDVFVGADVAPVLSRTVAFFADRLGASGR